MKRIVTVIILLMLLGATVVFAAGMSEEEADKTNANPLVVILIVMSYMVLAGFFSYLVRFELTPSFSLKHEDCMVLAVLSAIFWPIAMPTWGGVYLARYIVASIK